MADKENFMFLFIWVCYAAFLLFNIFRNVSKKRVLVREIEHPKLVWENEMAKQALANVDTATDKKTSYSKPTYIYSDEQLKHIQKQVYPDTGIALKHWLKKLFKVSTIVTVGVIAIFVVSFVFLTMMNMASNNF